jgi:uncharacterized protein YkwD
MPALALLLTASACSPFRYVSLNSVVPPSSPVASPSSSPSLDASPAPRASPSPAKKPAGAHRAPLPAPAQTPQLVNGVLIGSRQQALTNQARAAANLPPLAWSQCLANVASLHAMQMATAGRIYHGDGVDRDLACGLGSRQSGENVGETSGGVDDQRIFDAFMNSSGHRANILGPYRFIGTAWVVGLDGTGYVSVEFG